MSVYHLSGEFMRSVIAASLFVFICIFAAPAIAQHDEVGVPIVKAPYHLPVFTNEYVTVLKIDIPPGRNTGYHTHTEDSVSVNIVPADMTNQNLGSSEIVRGERAARGRATFTPSLWQGRTSNVQGDEHRRDAVSQRFIYFQESTAGEIIWVCAWLKLVVLRLHR